MAEERKRERRGSDRRKNKAMARDFLGMERRLDERRTVKRRHSSPDSSKKKDVE